jgi:hypothetical protein
VAEMVILVVPVCWKAGVIRSLWFVPLMPPLLLSRRFGSGYNPPTSDMFFNLLTKDRSAQSGRDFTAGTIPVTIPAGTTQSSVTVAILGDSTHEATETFTVNLVAPRNSGVVFTEKKVTVTIMDNDPVPIITFPASVVVREGEGPAPITGVLSNPTSSLVSFNFNVLGDTASPRQDFKAKKSAKGQVLPERVSVTVTVPIVNDSISEPSETFVVQISNVMNATSMQTSITVTIEDNDPAT